jgi:hypothetical protein
MVIRAQHPTPLHLDRLHRPSEPSTQHAIANAPGQDLTQFAVSPALPLATIVLLELTKVSQVIAPLHCRTTLLVTLHAETH